MPEVFKNTFAKAAKVSAGSFPYTVHTPGIKAGKYPTNETLLCMLDDSFLFFEQHADAIKTYKISLNDISYAERCLTLLRSWITIKGICDGEIVTLTIHFNTASESLFTPVVKKIRKAPNLPEENVSDSEISKFDYLHSLDFSFSTYAINSIVPGEKIVQQVFDENDNSITTLIILTDKELIVINDDLPNRVFGKYGVIWRFIPLSSIRSMSILKKTKSADSGHHSDAVNHLELSLHLKKKEAISYSFGAALERDLDLLVDDYEKLSSL